ncbi:M20 aminoacylase family protein [Amylibacter sp. IMCC11727]|uniref:M20 aminoacylase family protein n=1 Tax=Amylibacter sp. IMCC11727 TaxID=3039851 RepID=UPI00244E5397|nr:M20 aminoacylase family protein [Amylibacter sp. IMCC11727]WGI22430.1 M20 family metallopeptidase [Amylibacter sp. IMCC11727]
MPIVNRIADLAPEMKQWRHHLHSIPELGFDLHKTSAFVEEKLRAFGVDELHTGIAQTGMVAIINGQSDGPTIGLRADMDALPITENSTADHASTHTGKMHACGHDGHTTMLLGAAKYLVETRNFSGRVALIFQPAEEGGGGGQVMCAEGMMDRFNISQVFGIHNMPGTDEGTFHTTNGPLLAAADTFYVNINGSGGHGAQPENTRDPLVAGTAIVQGFQTISSRNLGGLDTAVISVGEFTSGTANNIVPDSAYISGTVRTFDKAVQATIAKRMTAICEGVATSYDVDVALEYEYGYPPTVNDAAKADLAANVARTVVGDTNVDANTNPIFPAEDFAYMLEERPGAYLFLGQGDGAPVHHPDYDFNDEIAPIGASFFAKLVETVQPR